MGKGKTVKVIVTDYIEPDMAWEAEQLKAQGIEFEAHQLKFLPEDEVLEKVRDADVIVVNMVKFPESLISRLENCKLIIRHGIGYDNVDVDACTKYGIQFAYQPDYCQIDVAEHAISLIFACARKVCRSRKTLDESSQSGQWDFTGLFPIYRMEGKTLGVLGVGRIGSHVVRKMQSFGFRIIGHDPYLSEKRRAAIQGIEWVDKEALFKEADLITVHTPLREDTRYIVNAETLALMKPTACLVNTSRGGMVDSLALAEALSAGKIACAAIDVYEVEPPAPEFELFKLDNIILTPHIGWASEEAGWEIRESILDDILAGCAGRDARCVVNEIRRS
ncbi:MAG: C-terminal binding protein [Kiritimatiellales bacterium]